MLFVVFGTSHAASPELYKFHASSPKDQRMLDAFHDQLIGALTSKDISILNQCFYWGDTPEAVRDMTIREIEEILEGNDFLSVYIFSSDDKRLNQGWVQSVSSSKLMNGHKYDLNLKYQWLCTVAFKPISAPTCPLIHKLYPIGVSPDGEGKIPVMHRIQ